MGKHRIDASDDESDNVEEEEAYLVEVITQARVVDEENKEFEYHVKWYGYTSDEDTWEPEENVAECTRLLKSFWKNVGKEMRKYPGPRGTEYNASQEWINKERRHFEEEVRKDQEKKDEERRKEKERRRKAKAAKTAAANDAPTQSRSARQAEYLDFFKHLGNDSDSDEVPLKAKLKNKGKEKEVPRTTSGIGKASSSTVKPGAPQRPTVQTSSSFSSTSKFAGMKIAKKAPDASLGSPLDSPTLSARDIIEHKPRPPLNATASASSSVIVKKVPPTRDDDSSKQFLPPRPRPSAPAPAPAAAPPPVKPTPASGEAVDNFLATVMSFGQSEAQKPENLASQPQTRPTGATITVPTGLKFTKKWSWTGELFVDNANSADKLCEITIHSTSETSEIGFRLGAILDSRDSLRFSKSYTRSELNLILQGLRKVDQIAKVGHRRADDKEPLQTLMSYLIRKNLVISCPGINHLGHVAEMIVFPSANKYLCERLNVPLSYKSADCLLVALLPWHVPPSKYDMRYLRPDELRDSKFEKELEEMRTEFSNLSSKPNVETALRILGFDFSFVKFLPSRKYCVWSFQVDEKPIERGRKFLAVRPETKALLDVLSFLKAENVGYDSADARIVFVHVGAVRNIWKLPGLVERRCNKPEVQFVTYGTHESVKPAMWGFHEIYPLGGIVTFTATALLENPVYVAELIEQIHKHPLWECYIHPSVLAVFTRLSCPDEDPLSVYAREPYHFGRILDLIEEGKVALMQSPALFEGSPSALEVAEHDKWIASQFTTIAKTPLQLLEECWSIFVAEYSNKTEMELRSTIENEIVTDLVHLQTQQVIRESYRRFVIIRAMQDEHIEFSKDGFEWRAVQDFNFGDGFPVHCIDLTRGEDQPLAA